MSGVSVKITCVIWSLADIENQNGVKCRVWLLYSCIYVYNLRIFWYLQTITNRQWIIQNLLSKDKFVEITKLKWVFTLYSNIASNNSVLSLNIGPTEVLSPYLWSWHMQRNFADIKIRMVWNVEFGFYIHLYMWTS